MLTGNLIQSVCIAKTLGILRTKEFAQSETSHHATDNNHEIKLLVDQYLGAEKRSLLDSS
jgi:hypothetical protein